jgi:hypothetical protein
MGRGLKTIRRPMTDKASPHPAGMEGFPPAWLDSALAQSADPAPSASNMLPGCLDSGAWLSLRRVHSTGLTPAQFLTTRVTRVRPYTGTHCDLRQRRHAMVRAAKICPAAFALDRVEALSTEAPPKPCCQVHSHRPVPARSSKSFKRRTLPPQPRQGDTAADRTPRHSA